MGTSGLEPPTSRLSGVRSNHLSYAPIVEFVWWQIQNGRELFRETSFSILLRKTIILASRTCIKAILNIAILYHFVQFLLVF